MENLLAFLIAFLALFIGLFLGLFIGKHLYQSRLFDLQKWQTETQTALDQERQRVLELTGAKESLEARLQEREQATQQLMAQLRETFSALSQEALSRNSQEFLRLAQQSFESLSKQAEGALEKRGETLRTVIQSLAEKLKEYDSAIQEMERRREGAFSALEERLRHLLELEQSLKDETNKLVTALKRPEVRGSWGEMQLRNAVELAGLSPYCDFVEQRSIRTEEGVLRPDMIIRLPGGGLIVVDNKVPLDAYLQALEAADPEERQKCLQRHAQQCRQHIQNLARKAYWDQFEKSPNCVVMFIPMESLYVAALEVDRDLMKSALESRVVIATPATFIALLYAVAYGWEQQKLAENLLEVRNLAAEFYSRLQIFMKHFSEVGPALNQALDKYNKAVSSANMRLYPQAVRLQELGVPAKEELPELKSVETIAADLRPELQAVATTDNENPQLAIEEEN